MAFNFGRPVEGSAGYSRLPGDKRMADTRRFTRRKLLRGGAALAALAMPAPTLAAAAQRLPARAHAVIRNAYVMTMEMDTGDIKDGDVYVRDGTIVAVGQKLSAPGAASLNGAGMIVLPGLIETHW